MNCALALAAMLSAGACAFHTSLAPRFLAPLQAATELRPAVIRILDLCFHAVGMLFAILAAVLAAAALGHLSADAARLCGVLAGSVAVLAGVSTIRAGLAPWRHPATSIFGAVAVLVLIVA